MASRAESRPEELLAKRGGAVELLRIPAFLFGRLSGLRGRMYDRGILPSARLDAPVVCVGNLSVGGTGKTPMVLHLAEALAARGRRPGILSRGYKAPSPDQPNDEARLFGVLAPDVPHVADADRVRGGRRLLGQGVDVVLLDDGFQHRRLARDLDLVLVDATRPWGLPATDGAEPVQAVLPRGLLRESPRALRRADAIVLTRADQVDDAERARLEDELFAHAPGKPILWAVHRPAGLRSLRGGEEVLSDLEGRTVDLISGIGNPDAFEASVRSMGAAVGRHERRPDHHAFRVEDFAPFQDSDHWIVTTAKDAVKLVDVLPEELTARVRVLAIQLAITRGAVVLEALLDALPRGSRERARAAMHEGLHG